MEELLVQLARSPAPSSSQQGSDASPLLPPDPAVKGPDLVIKPEQPAVCGPMVGQIENYCITAPVPSPLASSPDIRYNVVLWKRSSYLRRRRI
jgi:hypothetical protein